MNALGVPIAGVPLTKTWLSLALVGLPVPALAAGALVMRSAGLSASVWSQNVAAAGLGMLLCVAAAIPRRRRYARTAGAWLFAFGAAALTATFVSSGVEGVHRWVGAGSLRLHVAATLLPVMLVALYDGRRIAVFGPIVVSLCLFAQPDAAQAAAFAVAWGIIAVAGRSARETTGAVVVLVLAVGTLFRPDPLSPVPHVEGIVRLARSQSTGVALTGAISLLLLPLPFTFDASQRRLGAALAGYVLCVVLASCVGNYPVPVMGYGTAPILGYYLGAAAFLRRSGTQHERLFPEAA